MLKNWVNKAALVLFVSSLSSAVTFAAETGTSLEERVTALETRVAAMDLSRGWSCNSRCSVIIQTETVVTNNVTGLTAVGATAAEAFENLTQKCSHLQTKTDGAVSSRLTPSTMQDSCIKN